jgi:hypothetical protein
MNLISLILTNVVFYLISYFSSTARLSPVSSVPLNGVDVTFFDDDVLEADSDEVVENVRLRSKDLLV